MHLETSEFKEFLCTGEYLCRKIYVRAYKIYTETILGRMNI